MDYAFLAPKADREYAGMITLSPGIELCLSASVYKAGDDYPRTMIFYLENAAWKSTKPFYMVTDALCVHGDTYRFWELPQILKRKLRVPVQGRSDGKCRVFMNSLKRLINKQLTAIYPNDNSEYVFNKIVRLMESFLIENKNGPYIKDHSPDDTDTSSLDGVPSTFSRVTPGDKFIIAAVSFGEDIDFINDIDFLFHDDSYKMYNAIKNVGTRALYEKKTHRIKNVSEPVVEERKQSEPPERKTGINIFKKI